MSRKWSATLIVLLGTAGARADDEITFFDRDAKKETKIPGTIQSESPAQIVFKPATGSSRTIPAADVIDVLYNLTPTLRSDYRHAVDREAAAEKEVKADSRKRALNEALTRFKETEKSAKEDRAKRHLEFRIAKVLSAQADDAASVVAATDALSQFLKAHPNAWQRMRVADLLAAMQMRKGDWGAVMLTYDELSLTPDLDPESKLESAVKAAQALTRAGKHVAAEKKLLELAPKMTPGGRSAQRRALLLAECQSVHGNAEEAAKKLKILVDQISDPELKALAFNTLGDCHRRANRPRDAMWNYLWVDVIYHHNRDEHARALYHLVKLFTQFEDTKRGQQFREKLNSPQFAGLEYQRKLASEK